MLYSSLLCVSVCEIFHNKNFVFLSKAKLQFWTWEKIKFISVGDLDEKGKNTYLEHGIPEALLTEFNILC